MIVDGVCWSGANMNVIQMPVFESYDGHWFCPRRTWKRRDILSL
jgi:hypothetical protein